jgi:acetyl/propionyl-CoA carboxylase alpha subunit
MTGAALMAAKAVGYRNAGTVEFIVDGSGALRPDGFWFMEMNTRLQVEHPVSELITGRDFVELQFNIATGGKLPPQSEIQLNGHAVEARLCAEDPAHGFLPSSGRLEVFDLSDFDDEPSGGVTLRLDSAVEEGDTVPADYDSMIAKAIAHGPSRDAAFDALAQGLRNAEIWPLASNAAMLANLLDNDVMREGAATTNLVEANINELAEPDDQDIADALILGATGLSGLATGASVDPWAVSDGFRINAPSRATFVFDLAGEPREIKLEAGAKAHIGPEVFETDLEATLLPDGVIVSGAIDGGDVLGVVRHLEDGPVLFLRGRAIALRRPEYGSALEGVTAGDDIRSPMPGKILDVKAKAGASVKRGDPLVVMEAMKMEHTLTAPRDGVIAEVSATAGAQVAEAIVLVRLQPLPEVPA